jgi:hypothetical protein
MRFICLASVIIISVSGCSTVVFPTINAGCPIETANQDVSAAAVYALQQYGFSVAVASPDIGLIVSDWKILTSAGEEVAAAIFSGMMLGAYRSETYRERMQLTFSINRQAEILAIKPHKQQVTRLYGWSDAALDNQDMLLVQNIMTTAVSTMGGSVASLRWAYPPGHVPVANTATYGEPRETKALVNNPVAVPFVVGGFVVLFAVVASYKN